ncbi:MAG: hypothetical protein IKA32_03755 [Lentisphaeria bacterium]|nr:hypothetical protein [Lentisphaeria bacterium]
MFLFIRIAGLLLIAGGVYFLCVLLTLPPTLEEELERLPDFDHTVAARRLLAEKKYGEAKVLCQDIIENDLPGRRPAEIIVRICDEKLRSVKVRLRQTAEAFVTGNPGESVEQAGAAVVSDMLMYGDIRDLVMQGYYKVTGKETDPYIAAFAAAGLATEVFDAVDWLPSVFKALRRAGVVSGKLAEGVLDIFRRSAGRSRQALNFCRDMKDICMKGGFLRTKTVFKNLENADDIAAVARMMRKSPSKAHLISISAGKNTARVFRELASKAPAPSCLRKLLCKGPHGITIFLRFAKSVRKGNVETAVFRNVRLLKDHSGKWVWLIPVLLTGTGILLELKWILKLNTFCRKCARVLFLMVIRKRGNKSNDVF